MYRIGHGIVTGHKRIADSVNMHTSAVQAISIDEEAEELIMTTRNSVYHCPLPYCRFKKQDEYPEVIPDFEKIKEKYEGKISCPSIEPGKVLLVLSNFCEFYFHSLYYVPKDSADGKKLKYRGIPHIGTFQDSFLIDTEGYPIALRYFPHFQNIEFYMQETDGCPLYIENVGDVVYFCRDRMWNDQAGTGRPQRGNKRKCGKESPCPGRRRSVSGRDH